VQRATDCPPPGSSEAERQQHIAEIKQLLAAADLVSKDMFLTQPPGAEGRGSLCGLGEA
jgi:hypothetical protein